MNAPGSPSSPLQMKYFCPSGDDASAANFHFRPVGKPAPPRPRRPEARISSRTCSRVISRQHLVQCLVAAGVEVVVDVLGVDPAAVAQHQAILVLIEIVVDRGLLLGEHHPLVDRLAADDVLVDDLLAPWPA